ncbi:MAG: VF530 family protein [Endomicrobiales bacterium]
MTNHRSKDPLHGVTLEMVLQRLVERFGWEELGRKVRVRCFNFDPSIKSSLTFLRKTAWARKKVEDLYVWSERKSSKKSGRQDAGRNEEAPGQQGPAAAEEEGNPDE